MDNVINDILMGLMLTSPLIIGAAILVPLTILERRHRAK